MKATTKVLLSSIATIAMTASVAVGGTLALFTDEAVVNVAVTSGTVDVSATIKDASLKTYSRGILQSEGALTGSFANDASGVTGAVVENGVLTLTNITPGDKAEFVIEVTNYSNVDIQYRTVAYLTNDENSTLANYLVWKSTATEWTYLEGLNATDAAAGKLVDSVTVSVELPEAVTTQGLGSAKVAFTVEAIQGNGVGEYVQINDANFPVNSDGRAEGNLEDLVADSTAEKVSVILPKGKHLTMATAGHSGAESIFTDAEGSQDLYIEGAGAETEVTFTGAGVSGTRASKDGTLTMKNLTVVDKSVSYNEGAWEFTYLEFAGNLYFENVVFKSGIMLEGDANATFVNCTFITEEDSVYSVWVSDGNATFTNCTFKGTRGLKAHEDYGTDVTEVVVDNCLFDSISKKPGIAIGDLDATTVFTVKNSTFDKCQAGDQGLYIYESDTDVTTFKFTQENNVVMRSATAATQDELNSAITTENATNITLGAGEYKMPSVSEAKEFTIVGTKDTVIDNTLGAYMDSSKVTFEGVTIKGSTGKVNGNGSDYAALYCPNVTYINCTFVGAFRIGRDGATFIGCTFTNLGNDYVWTYGNDCTFIDCTFESEGKALLIYSDGGNEVANVTVKDCVFKATKGAKAGAIANQNCAAIEIHNYGNGVNLTTSGNTIDSDFSGEWRIKTYENGKPAIIVNAVTYTTIALDGKTMTIDANRNVTVNE